MEYPGRCQVVSKRNAANKNKTTNRPATRKTSTGPRSPKSVFPCLADMLPSQQNYCAWDELSAVGPERVGDLSHMAEALLRIIEVAMIDPAKVKAMRETAMQHLEAALAIADEIGDSTTSFIIERG